MNIFFVSMGCAKNTVDSERLMGRLVSLGHRIVEDPEEAETGVRGIFAKYSKFAKMALTSLRYLSLNTWLQEGLEHSRRAISIASLPLSHIALTSLAATAALYFLIVS